MHFNDIDWESVFGNQYTCDRIYVEDIYRRFPLKVKACASKLYLGNIRWAYSTSPNEEERDEFLDFIDGNGFEVKQVQPHTFHIIPQYKLTPVTIPWE